jgi:acetyl-CoA carboxylase biotin carboxyl carrier protein
LNLKDILELIDKVADRGIGAVEVEQAGTRLRIEGKSVPPAVLPALPLVPGALPPMPLGAPQAAAPATAAQAPAAEPDSEAGLHIITSPIVGTFYRSPNPESEAYASVGDHIAKGKVLCIVEAMKLMNEIEAERPGRLVEVLIQNGSPVEYGEALFRFEPV